MHSFTRALLYLLIGIYIIMLAILPASVHIFSGLHYDIFPALDLAVIFYLSTYRKIEYWQLFIIGILLDALYCTIHGLSSFILIISEFLIKQSSNYFLLRNYVTNLASFVCYTAFFLLMKYCIIVVLTINDIGLLSLLSYFLTTILSYPLLYFMLEKPLNSLIKHG